MMMVRCSAGRFCQVLRDTVSGSDWRAITASMRRPAWSSLSHALPKRQAGTLASPAASRAAGSHRAAMKEEEEGTTARQSGGEGHADGWPEKAAARELLGTYPVVAALLAVMLVNRLGFRAVKGCEFSGTKVEVRAIGFGCCSRHGIHHPLIGFDERNLLRLACYASIAWNIVEIASKNIRVSK